MARGPARIVDQAIKKQFTGILRKGFSEGEAFQILGIDRKTIKREAARDHEFAQSIKSAALEGKLLMLDCITTKAKTQWQAAAWFLERKYWNEFAQRRPDTFTTEDVIGLSMQFGEIAGRFIPADKKEQFAAEIQRLLNLLKKKRK